MDFTFDQVACDFVAGACLMKGKGNCSGALLGEYIALPAKALQERAAGYIERHGILSHFFRATFAGYSDAQTLLPQEVLGNKMSGHRGWSRGCGCRLPKGLHGDRLVIFDVEDGI
jgi:hypothetical protein